MAINDTYLVRDLQVQDGEDIMNTYYYQQITSGGNAQDLAEAFYAEIISNMIPFQSNKVTHIGVQVENRADPGDFHLLNLTSANVGSTTGDSLPKFVAWGFQVNRSATQRRHGAKRIPGVPESLLEVEGDPTSTALTALNVFAETLQEDLAGSVGTYVLRIPRGSFANAGVPTPDPHSGVVFKRVTTQNSRKR